jgi:hypothetical protein
MYVFLVNNSIFTTQMIYHVLHSKEISTDALILVQGPSYVPTGKFTIFFFYFFDY